VAFPEGYKGMETEIIPPRTVNMVTWLFAPDWLTVEQAQYLTGHDRGYMLSVIEADGVDLDCDGLIEKQSLWEWQETEALLPHWND